MIKRVRVKGYKSLKDVEVELRPLTVFIGPNASGKSNLFDALHLLSRLVTSDNLNAAFDQHRGTPLEAFSVGEQGVEGLLSQGLAQLTIEVDIVLIPPVNHSAVDFVRRVEGEYSLYPLYTIEELRYSVTIQMQTNYGKLKVIEEHLTPLVKDQHVDRLISRYGDKFNFEAEGINAQRLPTDSTLIALHHHQFPETAILWHELTRWQFYQLEPSAMRDTFAIKKVEHLATNGSDLAAFYNTLRVEDIRQFHSLEKTLKSLFGIERIEVEPDRQGMLQLQIVEKGVPHSVRVVSEGTLRMLGLLAILSPMALAKTKVLGYEEPENGVHPRRLKLIADLLNNAAEANQHLQILINTHSPVLPEYFEPDSLIVCRKEGRESKFIPFSHFQMNGHGVGLAFDDDEPETTFTQRVIRGDFDV